MNKFQIEILIDNPKWVQEALEVCGADMGYAETPSFFRACTIPESAAPILQILEGQKKIRFRPEIPLIERWQKLSAEQRQEALLELENLSTVGGLMAWELMRELPLPLRKAPSVSKTARGKAARKAARKR